jgi:hypothetical protein
MNRARRNPTRNEVVPRALTDRLKRHAAVKGAERPLGEPNGRRNGDGQLVERRSPEQMRDEGHGAPRAPERSVQRNLVDVLDEDVEPGAEVPMVVAARVEWEGVPRADAVDRESIDRCALRRPGPPATEERDLVTARRQTAKDLVEMDLGAASLWILTILPVDD